LIIHTVAKLIKNALVEYKGLVTLFSVIGIFIEMWLKLQNFLLRCSVHGKIGISMLISFLELGKPSQPHPKLRQGSIKSKNVNILCDYIIQKTSTKAGYIPPFTPITF
jgi:hypothetical protein